MFKSKISSISLALVGSLAFCNFGGQSLNDDSVASNNLDLVVSSSYQSSFATKFENVLADVANTIFSKAHADVVAPQAPPELSDTLIDFRTKKQLSESIYIEGRIDEENSLDIPSNPSDRAARVMRMSATYLPQYEIAVPRHGISILRFYDLRGYPMEVVSTRIENQGFLAETTAAPSEIMIRQFQGASTTLLQVRLKGINRNFVFMLKPLLVANQEYTVRTLITSMTMNYYVDGVLYKEPEKQILEKPNPKAKTVNFDNVDLANLEKDLIDASAIVLPLNNQEDELSKEWQEKVVKSAQQKKTKEHSNLVDGDVDAAAKEAVAKAKEEQNQKEIKERAERALEAKSDDKK